MGIHKIIITFDDRNDQNLALLRIGAVLADRFENDATRHLQMSLVPVGEDYKIDIFTKPKRKKK